MNITLAEAKKKAIESRAYVEKCQAALEDAQAAYNKAHALLEDATAKETMAWEHVALMIQDGVK